MPCSDKRCCVSGMASTFTRSSCSLASMGLVTAAGAHRPYQEVTEKPGTPDSAMVGTAGSTMDEVVTSFQQVTVLVTEISNASREQSGGIEQVTQAVSQMDEVTQQNAALVEEAAAAAESLEEQARSLVQAVGMFKLDGGSTTAGRSEAARPSRNLPTAALRTVSQRQLPRSAKPAAPRGTPGKQPPAHLAEAGEEWAEF